MGKYPCPCCGYYTYPVPPQNDCGYICPVCFWENDPFLSSPEEPSDSNGGLTLGDARMNYLELGACQREMLPYVRRPRAEEARVAAADPSSGEAEGSREEQKKES